MIVIDTDIFVDYLREYSPAVRFFQSIANRDDILFSAITEAELLSGNANADPKLRELLIHFLRRWTKVSLGNPISAFAGDLRREHNLSIPDAIIAATALSVNADLLTRNINDFKRVPELSVRAPY